MFKNMLKFRGKQLASGAVVNERMYYYVLDALDSNKDINSYFYSWS